MKQVSQEPKKGGRKPTTAQKKQAEKIFGKEAVLEMPPEIEVLPEQREAERRANVDAMQFAVQQLTTPAAPTEPPKAPPEVVEQFNEELKKLQEKFGVRIAPAVQPKQSERLKSHGITRPGPGTETGKIWQVADEITSSQHGVPATIVAVRTNRMLIGVNDNTIKTQYARWRKYNGVTGRIPTVQPDPQPEGQDEGLSKAIQH